MEPEVTGGDALVDTTAAWEDEQINLNELGSTSSSPCQSCTLPVEGHVDDSKNLQRLRNRRPQYWIAEKSQKTRIILKQSCKFFGSSYPARRSLITTNLPVTPAILSIMSTQLPIWWDILKLWQLLPVGVRISICVEALSRTTYQAANLKLLPVVRMPRCVHSIYTCILCLVFLKFIQQPAPIEMEIYRLFHSSLLRGFAHLIFEGGNSYQLH
jgi:hypothetical protein